jgi:hypothetical protein
MNAAIPGFRATLGLGARTVGFVAVIALIGCAVGAWFAGPVSTRLDRNRVMLIAGTGITVGSLAAALSNQVVLTGLARLGVGLGIGAASAVVPAYPRPAWITVAVRHRHRSAPRPAVGLRHRVVGRRGGGSYAVGRRRLALDVCRGGHPRDGLPWCSVTRRAKCGNSCSDRSRLPVLSSCPRRS